VTKHGYALVVLCANGKKNNKRVHCLVAESFLGSRPDGKHVNHKDGNKLNNSLNNLEYVTPGENQQHAYDTGLKDSQRAALSRAMAGEKHPRAKLSDADAARLLALKGTMSLKEAGQMFNIGWSMVSKIWTDKNRKHLKGETV
jgi:hypothetical protein